MLVPAFAAAAILLMILCILILIAVRDCQAAGLFQFKILNNKLDCIRNELDGVRDFLSAFSREINQQLQMNQAELAAGLKQITDQVGKVAAEQGKRFDDLSAKIKALEDAINAGDVKPEVEAALAEAKTALQALDDTIPDAPAA